MEYILKNAKIVLENEIFSGDLEVKEGKISKISKNLTGEILLDVKNKYIVPGFIDIHIHGAKGFDVMDATDEAIFEISKYLGQHGVTSFLPTLLTQSKDKIIKALEVVGRFKDKRIEGATVVGVQMEGPYFSLDYRGAQNPEFIKEGFIEEIKEYINVNPGLIKIVSLAPEKNSDEVIKFLKNEGIIVAMGHTGASCERIKEACKCGLSHATHTFNGMKGLHHREPGALGAVMLIDEIYAELILDKIHVHPDSAKILLKCKGTDKVVLVSDCIMAGGMPEGEYTLGGLDVIVNNGEARVANGNLAGSTLTIDIAFKNAIEVLGLDIIDAVKLCSSNAAKELGIANKGYIKEGLDADFLVVNEDYSINSVFSGGKKLDF